MSTNKNESDSYNQGYDAALRSILEKIEVMESRNTPAEEQLEHVTEILKVELMQLNWRIFKRTEKDL